MRAPLFRNIFEAQERVAAVARETPLIHSHALSRESGAPVYLKLENLLQPVGSFKLRGAYNKMSRLTAEEKEKGVVTVSAGNHAQAVACCAAMSGLDAVIFMPENTPQIKINNTKRFGVTIRLEGGSYDESERLSHIYEKETGRTFIHPFCDACVIEGQGTVCMEILRRLPGVETLVVPVGGGGLITGCAVAAKTVNPGVRVIGVQPEASAPFLHSKKAGRCVETQIGDSIADALTGEIISEEFFTLVDSWVDEIVMVSEQQIERGIFWMLQNHAQVIEGGAAVGISALLDSMIDLDAKTTAVIVTGCGIDVSRLNDIIQKHI